MKSYDLTTVDMAKAFARIKRADTDADTRLPKIVSGVSRMIARYTRRQFVGMNDAQSEDGVVDVDLVETKTFEYDGEGYLSLEPYEAREIVSATLNGRTLTLLQPGERMSTTTYSPSPRAKTREGTYWSLRLPKTNTCRPGGYEDLVEIEAKWGIVGVDEDLELAALHAIAAEYRNPEGMPQRTIGDGLQITEDEGDGSALPRKSRQILSGFMRG